nr:hypothetical protein [Streptomyces bauhiniae]
MATTSTSAFIARSRLTAWRSETWANAKSESTRMSWPSFKRIPKTSDLLKEFGPYFEVAAQRLDGHHTLSEQVVEGGRAGGCLLDADQLVLGAEDVADLQSPSLELLCDDVLFIEQEIPVGLRCLMVEPVLVVRVVAFGVEWALGPWRQSDRLRLGEQGGEFFLQGLEEAGPYLEPFAVAVEETVGAHRDVGDEPLFSVGGDACRCLVVVVAEHGDPYVAEGLEPFSFGLVLYELQQVVQFEFACLDRAGASSGAERLGRAVAFLA